VGDLNTTLSTTDRPSRPKTNKVTSEVLYTLDQLDILNICKVFHLAIRLYTFFSAAHGTFSKIGHILGLKVILNKFKKTEITLCIISDYNRIKQGVNNSNKKPTGNIQTHGDRTTHC
jgi:hypothetical protein